MAAAARTRRRGTAGPAARHITFWAGSGVVIVAVTVLTLGMAEAAGAQANEVSLGAYGEPLLFEAPPGAALEVAGVGRYSETIEVRSAPDGRLVAINDVSLRTYLEGLAEMPTSWPMEALKAQAVAARTYAWYSILLGTFRAQGYDLCAEVACQVFRGREPGETPGGERWVQAVASTEGEVLLEGSAPILARYFSSSGGHTRDNEEVFPGEGPKPYLQGAPDPEDAVSHCTSGRCASPALSSTRYWHADSPSPRPPPSLTSPSSRRRAANPTGLRSPELAEPAWRSPPASSDVSSPPLLPDCFQTASPRRDRTDGGYPRPCPRAVSPSRSPRTR
ncbi:MAG: SpoIID/LytB domain-containing protein [Actinomycetota bacterium]|nr:SpoIID/LytB domain-containing protein [Actinomycetota bacterium]